MLSDQGSLTGAWEKMIEFILAVLAPLVSKLTEDFLDRRRDRVSVVELQDQISRLLASRWQVEADVAQVRMAVIALTRYLARTQGEIFVLRDDLLELSIPSNDRRQETVGHAISDFNSLVEARLNRRPSLRSPKNPVRDRPVVSSEALNEFFDGFEEGIMRARLGREGPSD